MTSRSGDRGDIQGLRALAVLLVVLAHAGFPWLRGGFVGVDVGFVVSGFLITALLLRESAETGRISDEWSIYWPTSDDQPFADFFNNVHKYVATATLLTRE
jgi:peptidoglycan/LPS O-acetylase OafA/YrhL